MLGATGGLFLVALGYGFLSNGNRQLDKPREIRNRLPQVESAAISVVASESATCQLQDRENSKARFISNLSHLDRTQLVGDQAILDRFSNWERSFLVADPKVKASAGLLAEGEKLALQRRAVLKELIESDPEEALALVTPDGIRRQLPESVSRYLEMPVAGCGDFRVTVADDLVGVVCEVHREVSIGETRYSAFVYGRRLRQISQTSVLLKGIAIDQSLAVWDDPVPPPGWGQIASNEVPFLAAKKAGKIASRSGPGATTALSLTQGMKTLLFMPVAFADDPTPPLTHSAANQLMSQVNQWYTEQSYNSTAIISDVTPLLILPQTKAYYAAQGVSVLRTDARSAALAAGFDTNRYDLDIVNNRSLGAPNFNFAGASTVGGKGLMLQVPTLAVTVHELGHNYGLWHANSWLASGDSVIGPGSTVEYGNTFDTMGPQNSNPAVYEFNACFKNQLDWLASTFVQNITVGGLYRIYAYDVPNLVGGQKYALRIQKDYARAYWAEFRQKFTGNPWTQSGVLLNWTPWNNFVGNSLGGTVLLDTTPGSPSGNGGKDDAPVVIGRTFSDIAAGLHITPLAKGTATSGTWIDLQVNLGAFTGNIPPVLQIAADQTVVAVNAPVNFNAIASDANGDALAYYWEFGDLTFGSNSPIANKSWSISGEYIVRCTVSDMKGGVASRNLVVTVGSPGTFRVAGRVIATDGTPVEGVRVYDALTGTSYRAAFTDTDGYYVLANLARGNYTLSAAKYGYALTARGWSNPIIVGPDLNGQDWTAAPSPVLSVTASDPGAAESGADSGVFTLSRTGSVAAALTVKFNLSGTAAYPSDFALSPTPTQGASWQLVIPAGVGSLSIVLTPVSDASVEGPETATMTLFEDPAYVLGSFSEATVTIADGQAPGTPTVTVSASDDLATESGSDTGVFLFTRNGSLAADLTVNYAVSGSATNGVDFTALSGEVLIPAGQATAVVTFNAVDDSEAEGNESVIVSVQPDPAYNIGTPSSATVTIVDDDPPLITITATDETAVEGSSDTGIFTVTRVGNLAMNLVVNYTLSGTASNGADYVALPGTLTIPAGQDSANFTVTPINDSLVEGTETVVATLASNPGYNIGNPGRATVTMIDDDSPGVALAATDTSAAEAGPDSGVFTFTRTGSTANPLTVYFSVSGSAINGADYLQISNSIVIPIGSATALLIITPIDDNIKESDETVVITLVPSPNSSYSVMTASPKTVTIADNDTGSQVGVGFAAASSSGPESQFIVNVNVALSAPSPIAVFVDCKITGGTAVNGQDYATDLPKTLYFPVGVVSQNLTIVGVNDNSMVQPDRTVVVTLSNPVNAQLDAIASHTYTILDDDGGGGAVTVIATDANASETGPKPGTFRFSRSGVTSGNLTVNFQVSGTASSPSDYVPIGTSVLIPAGQNYQDVLVTPIDDNTPEPMETVVVTITSAPGATIGTANSATVFIADNDQSSAYPVVSVVASDPNASEVGPDPGTFVIRRDGDTSAALPVKYTVSGTAANGSDYASIGTSITIPAGASETTITILPTADALNESEETVVLTLTIDGTYRAAPTASVATVTIYEGPLPASVGFAATASAGGENVSPAFLPVSLSAAQPTPVTVHYAVTGGTATGGGVDYVLSPGTLTFAPGEVVKSIPITIIDDTNDEPDETIIVTLDSPNGAALNANTTHTYTIDNILATLTVTPTTAFNVSGPGGGPFSPASMTYTLSNIADTPLSWAASANAAWVDLSAASGTLNPGASADVTVSLNAQAAGLLPQIYTAAVAFTNVTNNNGNTSCDVNLNVLIPTPIASQITLADGNVLLRFWGIPGVAYDIVRSIDLGTWSSIGRRTAPSTGIIEFTDTAPPGGRGFYRTASP
jgi:hypothetical protein